MERTAVTEELLLRSLILTKDFAWPEPIYIDFIYDLGNATDPVVLHYKSGSNYQPWQSVDYNLKKTQALKEMLNLL